MWNQRSIGLLLAFITLLVYLPATNYQFVNFDDPDYVAANPMVQQGLTWRGIKWAFESEHSSNWHPLTWLSHMIDCDLFRLNPAGPHLINILFHSANTGLLFTLLFRFTQKLWPCAFIAALFAWHPLHVESVAWIAERKDVLSTFFSLLTLLSYTCYAEKHSNDIPNLSLKPRLDYFLTLLFFVLALLSKPMPVTLPLVMLLLDFWPLQRVKIDKLQIRTVIQLILEKTPFFLCALVLCIITVSVQHSAESTLAGVPFGFRLENAVTAYAGYLWKMILPRHLSILYPLVAPIPSSLIIESIIVLTGISTIVWIERKLNPWLLVGWLWFLVTLVPVIGLVQVGGQSMADRYSYFPLIGIFFALTFSVEKLVECFAFLKKLIILLAIFILGAMVALTENQLHYWRNSELLFNHAIAVQDSASARISLGVALQDQNRIAEAMTQFIVAIRLNPESSLAYSDLGRLLKMEGKFKSALHCYQEAVKYNPQTSEIYDNFGLILVKLKRLDEAMKKFSTAARVDPADAQPYFLMARLLLQEGHDVEAIPELRMALQRQPDDPTILFYTATVLAADKNNDARSGNDALVLAKKLVTMSNQQQPAALDTLAMSYAETGNFDKAIQTEEQAINLVQANDQKDELLLMQQRLQLYEKHQPWRESFKEN